MIRRHSSSGTDNTDDKVLEGAKKAMYVLIIAAAIMWLSPYLFPGGGTDAYTEPRVMHGDPFFCKPGTDECIRYVPSGTGDDMSLADRISAASTEARTVSQSIMDTAAYVLTVCAVISIVIMRVRVSPTTTRP